MSAAIQEFIVKACFLDRCNYWVGPDWSALANFSEKNIDFKVMKGWFFLSLTKHFLGCKAPRSVLCCVDDG